MAIEIDEIDVLATEGERILRDMILVNKENLDRNKQKLMIVKSYLHTIGELVEEHRRRPKARAKQPQGEE